MLTSSFLFRNFDKNTVTLNNLRFKYSEKVSKVFSFISNRDDSGYISNGSGIKKLGELLKNASIFLKETEGPSFYLYHGYFLSDELTIK